MQLHIPLREVFTLVTPPGVMDPVIVTEYECDEKKRTVHCKLQCPIPLRGSILADYRDAVVQKYRLASLNFSFSFTAPKIDGAFMDVYGDYLKWRLTEAFPMCRFILNNCSFYVKDDTITLTLKHGCRDMLQKQHLDTYIEHLITAETGHSLPLVIAEETEIVDMGLSAARAVTIKTKPKKEKPADQLFGYPFTGQAVPLSDIQPSEDPKASSIIEGEIINMETRELTKTKKTLFLFGVTDGTGSLSCKIFAKEEDADKLRGLKPGDYVRLRGNVAFDSYAREVAMSVRAAIKTEKEKPFDDAETKRVELHLHTNYSALDGVSTVKSLIARAVDWGMPAIAITDHGVVQAFPEALKAKKGLKSDIKILYGMEAYLSDEPLTCDVVMLCTKEENDQLSAIGAVLFAGGKIADTFCRVVIDDTTGQEFIDWLGDAPVLTEDGSAVLSLNKILESPLPNMQLTLKNAAPLAVETDGSLPSLLSRFFPDDEPSDAPEEQSAAMAKVWQELIPLLEAREYSDLYSVIHKTPGTILDKKGKKVNSFHAVILAKNRTGMVNLYKLVSDSNLKYFEKKRPRIPKHLFMRYREGLILGSACEAGELFRAMFQKLPAEKYEGIARFYDYLEIQPVGNNMFMLANGMVSSTRELEEMNIRIVELAKQLGKPFVATCDVHFLDAADEVYRRILMAGQGFDDADRQAPLYFRNTKQMLEEFRYLSEEDAYAAVVTNTNWVADQVEDQSPIRPDNCPPQIENSAEDLRRLCYEKATRLYGDPLPEPVQSRLEKELQPIIRQGYDVMYMIAQKLVQKSNEDGYLVGSRGSVGSSIVAFMSGITEINSMAAHYICPDCKYLEFPETPPGLSGCDLPDKICPNCGAKLTKDGHDIPFETFLGFHADKQPDIDLNFSGDYQAEAHKYTEVIFGKGYCFKAGTVSTVAEKTALGYVLKYFEERGITVNNAERDRLVKGCTGVKRTTGQHPGGIIVCPKTENIYEFTPVQHPADDPTSDIITTHFDYHSIDQNLLKLDILGHDDPTVLRMLQDITGIDPQTIPLDDKKTMSLFTSTEALGVKPEDIGSETGTFAIPEFGTSFVRGMLLDTKPTAFSDLIRISGLSHGTDVWLGNAQELVKSGTCTLSGCICCRDDIMSYLISKNMDPGLSFKTMESVRKGKGLTEEMETAMREHEVPDWYIDSCKKIKYMFPKAHAAAYVTNAFRIAWYKVHYPLAFYAACFSVRFLDDFDYNTMAQGKDKLLLAMEDLQRKGKMQKLTAKEQGTITVMEVLREMYARGFSFAKIDLYESDAKRFRVVDGKLLPPFAAISGLGGSAAAAIAEARAAGEFTSKEDMKNRVGGAKVVTLLSDAGILDDMMESSQTTLF